ncbi:unnamed protein product [Brachionus calyciflorus]|uniref:Uncharacterized protein n=1 Tax=Brachionus calyciflorus TaxID=104777 RepID=A0A814CM66_9BILA|nr:unnamed protein product [Brachionus calyciflorus]
MSADNININQDEGKQDTIVNILDGTARDKIKKLKWGELRHLAYLLEKSYKVSKDAISIIRNSTEIEFKTVEELKNFIKTTLESLDEEKSNIHKEAEHKNLQKEFTDDATSYIEKLEVANKSLSEEKETALENERRSHEMNKNAYQLYYDTTNFDNTLHKNESVQPKKSQQVQFKLDETQLNLMKTSLFSDLLGRKASTNNLVVPKTIKKMDPLTPKFTGTSKEDVENWLFTIEQSFNKALIGYTDRLVETIPFVGDYPFDRLRKHVIEKHN